MNESLYSFRNLENQQKFPITGREKLLLLARKLLCQTERDEQKVNTRFLTMFLSTSVQMLLSEIKIYQRLALPYLPKRCLKF